MRSLQRNRGLHVLLRDTVGSRPVRVVPHAERESRPPHRDPRNSDIERQTLLVTRSFDNQGTRIGTGSHGRGVHGEPQLAGDPGRHRYDKYTLLDGGLRQGRGHWRALHGIGPRHRRHGKP